MKHICCNHKLTKEEIKSLLTKNGINKTKSKMAILAKLSESKEPLSAQQIHEELDACNLSTVFRTLTQFKDKNLIQEVNLDEGFLRYQLTINSDEDKQHHHHFVRCRNCGKISQIENCDLSIFEKAITKLGFTQMEHRLEFSGLCSRCS